MPSRGLRVAYDCGPLLDAPTGVGRYTRELAVALEARGIELTRYAVSFGGARVPGVARWRTPARVAQATWRASTSSIQVKATW